MEPERIALSQRERDRLKVLHEVKQKHLTQVEAAARLKVGDRQVRRMLLRLRERGDHSLVHGLRGRPSNHKLAARLEQKMGSDWCSVFQIRQSVALFADLGSPHDRHGQARDTLKSHLVFDVVVHIVCLGRRSGSLRQER
jgi:DNA-binding transcriptional regulator LsrR (DeoR family)